MGEALSHLDEQMNQLGADRWRVNTDMKIDPNKWPNDGGANLTDPGVTVTFVFEGRFYRLACDRWKRIEDNLHACVLYIEGQRGIERCGAGTVRQALQGHLALPNAEEPSKALEGPPAATNKMRNFFAPAIKGLVKLTFFIAGIWILLALGACDQIQHLDQEIGLYASGLSGW